MTLLSCSGGLIRVAAALTLVAIAAISCATTGDPKAELARGLRAADGVLDLLVVDYPSCADEAAIARAAIDQALEDGAITPELGPALRVVFAAYLEHIRTDTDLDPEERERRAARAVGWSKIIEGLLLPVASDADETITVNQSSGAAVAAAQPSSKDRLRRVPALTMVKNGATEAR